MNTPTPQDNRAEIRPLCMSFRAPPSVRPQAILIGKMLPEWIRQGIDPVVLTYTCTGSWKAPVPVHHVPAFSPNRLIKTIPPARRLAEKMHLNSLAVTATSLVKQYRLNLLFSFSNPQESNLLGAELKKRLNMKFVSHFSDPYSDNPLNTLNSRGVLEAVKKERFIINQSDRIIFPSRNLAELVMRKFPPETAAKAVIIPHCFDKAAYPPRKQRLGEKPFLLSHIGAFYEKRTPEPLFAALATLKNSHGDLDSRLTVRLLGADSRYTGFSPDRIRLLIKQYALEDIVAIHPSVSYAESLQAMVDSDALVVIDADLPESPFLPSKLIDYVGSGSPIIGITPAKSPCKSILDQLGAPWFGCNQTGLLSDYLEKLLYNGATICLDTKHAETFTVQSTTKLLHQVFEEVLSEQ